MGCPSTKFTIGPAPPAGTISGPAGAPLEHARSSWLLAGGVPPTPPPTTGKFGLEVQPAIGALPAPSIAIADTWSPRYRGTRDRGTGSPSYRVSPPLRPIGR